LVSALVDSNPSLGQGLLLRGAASEGILREARIAASLESRDRYMQVSSLLSALCIHRGVVGELIDGGEILPHMLTKRRAGCEIRCVVCACCEIPVAGDVCDTLGKAKYSGDYGGEGDYASTMDEKQIASIDHDALRMQKFYSVASR
jgi:hypothetical protein